MNIDIQPNSQVVITDNGISTTYIKNNPPIPLPILNPLNPRLPNGKGMLIWQLAKTANGNMALMAQQAKEARFDWISIKVIERGLPLPRNVPFIKNAISELRKVGISVRGWGYLYPDADQIGQAKKTADYIKELGLDGYEMDVEGEWKQPINKHFLADTYVTELRKNLPDLGIGLCSFRYPNLHLEIPWEEFLSICDYHAPQVYWIGARLAGAPEANIQKSFAQLIKLKDIPYCPVGSATWSDDKTWEPSVDQLNNFYITVKEFGCPGYGWYEWFPAFSKQEWWKAIGAHK
jgi:hypothetical protein